MSNLKVGDKVVRKTGRNKTFGIIERIYHAYGNPNGRLRATVRWLGANRTRLGANSPDKHGGILLDTLTLVIESDDRKASRTHNTPNIGGWNEHSRFYGTE